MLTRATAAVLLAAGVLLTGCSSSSSPTATSTTGANASKAVPDATSAYTTIHAAVPTSKLSLTVTEANDGNHLLGRPHQYTSAVKFTDSRISESDTAGLTKGDVSYGGGIEVFANHDDAQARATYIQAIVKASPLFSEYDYVSGSVVVRVSHFLSPTQAGTYKTAASHLG